MKRKMPFLIAALLGAIFTVNAQGGFQRPSVEERVKTTMQKLESFNLDDAKKTAIDSIFTQSYKALDAKRDQARTNTEGGEDRAAIREEMRKLIDERDEKLKKVFTEEQFKKWKEEIEPSMGRRRGRQ
jgi:acyl-CoA reductase-like NAD-dependent aldehyde dehydrogenase